MDSYNTYCRLYDRDIHGSFHQYDTWMELPFVIQLAIIVNMEAALQERRAAS